MFLRRAKVSDLALYASVGDLRRSKSSVYYKDAETQAGVPDVHNPTQPQRVYESRTSAWHFGPRKASAIFVIQETRHAHGGDTPPSMRPEYQSTKASHSHGVKADLPQGAGILIWGHNQWQVQPDANRLRQYAEVSKARRVFLALQG